MKLADIFKRLGFPKHADLIYNALCKSKDSLLVTTIAERAHVTRVAVYRCLPLLLDRGLIRTTRIGRRLYYNAENSRRLQDAITIADTNSGNLLKHYVQRHEKEVPESVRFLQGPSGIRKVFDEVISLTKTGDTFYRYTSERDLNKVNTYLSSTYRTLRDKKKIERLVISNPLSAKQKKSRLERFIKFIPSEADLFEQNIIQLVYNDRLAIIDLNTEQVVIIQNKQLADFQKVIFKLLYKRL